MNGTIASLYRHPVKGFTPEALERAMLSPGTVFPGDRMYAVENGPSGFDSAAPAWVSKQKFTVLATIPAVAAVRPRWDDESGVLSAAAPGATPIRAALNEASGRDAFARWLGLIIPDDVRGPLKVVAAPGHRFTDHPLGQVSVINLASVRDLEAKIGQPVDPLRFRANLYVEGWPAWVELDWQDRAITLGGARAKVFSPIVRCAATCVDPVTADKDIDIPGALHSHYGHLFCGIYVHVTQGGEAAVGDASGLEA